uniref:PDGF_2 domain-containing protein n=1 Tax=Heterorhabditis bacteriophora TaxID=37862 RepID=A0A1I7X8H4_HETBA
MINTASIYKSPSQHVSMEDSHKDLDDHTAEHLSLFGSIKQGNDTCQLQSVCVPIPIENENPQVIIYPKCYEVMQCVGSCCDSFERCHPHSIRKLQKPISQCPPGFVLGPSCKCECANSADRDSCLGNHIWNEHNCTCNCEHITCSKNNILDRERCECISQKEKSEVVRYLISWLRSVCNAVDDESRPVD